MALSPPASRLAACHRRLTLRRALSPSSADPAPLGLPRPLPLLRVVLYLLLHRIRNRHALRRGVVLAERVRGVLTVDEPTNIDYVHGNGLATKILEHPKATKAVNQFPVRIDTDRLKQPDTFNTLAKTFHVAQVLAEPTADLDFRQFACFQLSYSMIGMGTASTRRR